MLTLLAASFWDATILLLACVNQDKTEATHLVGRRFRTWDVCPPFNRVLDGTGKYVRLMHREWLRLLGWFCRKKLLDAG